MNKKGGTEPDVALIITENKKKTVYKLKIKAVLTSKSRYTIMDVGSDFLDAFACFIAFFFVFNLTIPTELKNTFSFIESYF